MYNELVYNNIITNKISETFSKKDDYKIYYSIVFLGLYTYKNPTLFVNEDYLNSTLGKKKEKEEEKPKDDGGFDIGKMLGDATKNIYNGVINGLGDSNTINSGKTVCNLMPELLQPHKYCTIVKEMEKNIEKFKKDENYEFQENPVTVFIIYRFITNISMFKIKSYITTIKTDVYEKIKYDYDFFKMYNYINSKCENKEENKEYSTIKFFEKEKEKDPNAKTFPEFVKNYFNKKVPSKIVYVESSCNDKKDDCNKCEKYKNIAKNKEKKTKWSSFFTKTDEEE